MIPVGFKNGVRWAYGQAFLSPPDGLGETFPTGGRKTFAVTSAPIRRSPDNGGRDDDTGGSGIGGREAMGTRWRGIGWGRVDDYTGGTQGMA